MTLRQTVTDTGDLAVVADNAATGVFPAIVVRDYAYGINAATGKPDGRSLPALVYMQLQDGRMVAVWPNGEMQVTDESGEHGYAVTLGEAGATTKPLPWASKLGNDDEWLPEDDDADKTFTEDDQGNWHEVN